MRGRFGLRARMTASYVLVTAAAVIVVEAVAIGFLIPNYLAGQDLMSRVDYTASSMADKLAVVSTSPDTLQLPADYVIGEDFGPGPGKIQDLGQGLLVPYVRAALPQSAGALTAAVVMGSNGVILASSDPVQFPVGANAEGMLPDGALKFERGSQVATSNINGHDVIWALEPVYVQLTRGGGVPGTRGKQPEGFVYVQAPAQAVTFAGSLDQAGPLLQAGVAVLLLALPVGAVFGLLTTRGTVRRLGSLAGGAAVVADGDFAHRIPEGAADELGRLERSFNEMAERLSGAMSRERSLADRGARQAERNRISRELHDSISQDLFSIALLGAGIEKALPDGSPLRKQARTLVETVEATNREMRALLMELRPAALDDRGLVPALEDLAAVYEARFGVDVKTDLEAVAMSPAVELAALRIAQEGFANAVRHAQPKTIRLALHGADGRAELVIADDGQGFEPGTNGSGERLGLRLMRERVEELDGTLAVSSRPGEGTVLSASLPGLPA
jgi:signal transduction histidine kinase